jgi:hypothetical protein
VVWNNKRSKDSELRRKQRYQAKRFVFETSWQDRILTEIIETSTPEMIDNYVSTLLTIDEPQVYYSGRDWTDGLVLISQLQFSIYQHMLESPSKQRVSNEDLLMALSSQ